MEYTEQEIRQYLTGAFGQPMSIYPVIDSTNNAAKLLAKNNAPHGAAVLARRQTAGKGRLGRSFHSPAGQGIYLTVILRPALEADAALMLTPAAAVATARAVAAVTGVEAKIKWVNDLYVQGKKLCGILTESALGKDGRLEYAVVGIGVNLLRGELPEELIPKITSLEAAGGHSLEPARLIAEILNRLEEVCGQLETRAFLEEYRARSCVLGKQVWILKDGVRQPVRVVAITGDAALEVETASGVRLMLASGEISLKGDFT